MCCGRNPDNFCTACGKPTRFETIEAMEREHSRGDIALLIKERLSTPYEMQDEDRDLWFPNGGLRAWRADIDDQMPSGSKVLRAGEVIDAESAFLKTYSTQLRQMARLYKSEPEICFGVITYWM